jgi:hypothetical protein
MTPFCYDIAIPVLGTTQQPEGLVRKPYVTDARNHIPADTNMPVTRVATG